MRSTIGGSTRFQSFYVIFWGLFLISAMLGGCGGVSDGSMDGDSPAVKLLSGTVMFSEDPSKGGIGSLPVALATAPNGNVVLDVVSSDESEFITIPKSLTFTPDTWDKPQIIYLQGNDDYEIDGNQTCKVILKVNTDPKATADTTGYRKLGNVIQEVTVLDDDKAAVTVSPTTLTLSEKEEASFNVRLNTVPDGEVVIKLSPVEFEEATTNGVTSLTFNAENWKEIQIVSVKGIDNALNDGDLEFSIELAIDPEATTDTTGYSEVDVADVAVFVTEAVAGVNVIPGTTTFSEDGSDGSGSFLVNLKSRPDGDVVLDIWSQDESEATVSRSQLTFTPENWATRQTVLLSPQDDDLVDGNMRFDIVININPELTEDTTGYQELSDALVEDVPVTVIDNDRAGVTVEPTQLTVRENGESVSFSVRLNSQPSGLVTLRIVSEDTTEADVDRDTLEFDETDWQTVKTVTVSSADDSEIDGNQSITIVVDVDPNATNDSTGYAELSSTEVPDVGVTVQDDDKAEVTVTPIKTQFSENGESGQFTVELNTIPNGTVYFDVLSRDTTEASVTPRSLTFTHSNWSTPQTVVIAGVNDDIADGNQSVMIEININAANTSDTTGYEEIIVSPVEVTVTDDDRAGLTADPEELTISESGGASFGVRLNTRPSGDVTLALQENSPDLSVDADTLTFTRLDWSTPQPVNVSGINNAIADGPRNATISIKVASAATDDTTGYVDLAVTNIPVTVQDDDTAGVTVTPGITTFQENAETGTFTVGLQTEPVGDVIITVESSDTSEATVNPKTLIFTSLDWATDQTVTLTGVDDYAADGNQTFPVILRIDGSSEDPTYKTLTIEDVNITVKDNDTAGVTVTPITTDFSENGGTGSFTVGLNTEPIGLVEIKISSSDTTEATILPEQQVFSFTADDWRTAKKITVYGVDDPDLDGDQVVNIGVGIGDATTAQSYLALLPEDVPDVPVTVRDDETVLSSP